MLRQFLFPKSPDEKLSEKSLIIEACLSWVEHLEQYFRTPNLDAFLNGLEADVNGTMKGKIKARKNVHVVTFNTSARPTQGEEPMDLAIQLKKKLVIT